MQQDSPRWRAGLGALLVSATLTGPMDRAAAQTAASANPTPEEWVPTDPIPPGNEARPALTPGQGLPPAEVPAPPPPPTTAELLDYGRAFDRLGARMPRGTSVAVGIVEGDPGSYGPDPQHPSLIGLPLTLHSGPSTPSGHAQGVLQAFVGRRGVVPEPRAVGSWSVQHWMTGGYLQLGTPLPPRLDRDLGDDAPRVWSHSWIGTDAARAVPVLRRVDYVVDQHGVVMCVGVNNGKTSAVPPMLGSAYNVLAVGADDGNSSGGSTQVETVGRSKPDLVAPGKLTSFSTPVVAGCAALLLDHADALHRDDEVTRKRATRPEVIKATLMAGAQKHHAWRASPPAPLDEHFGAGRVNLDASLRILEGGPVEPGGRITRGKAWAYATLEPRGVHRFTLEAPRDLGAMSVILTWHRRIDGQPLVLDADFATPPARHALWQQAPRLADLDLRLVRIDAAGQPQSEVALSASRVDNVEHLYLPALPAGRYALEVVRDAAADPMKSEAWTYALAWRLEPPNAPAAAAPAAPRP